VKSDYEFEIKIIIYIVYVVKQLIKFCLNKNSIPFYEKQYKCISSNSFLVTKKSKISLDLIHVLDKNIEIWGTMLLENYAVLKQ